MDNHLAAALADDLDAAFPRLVELHQHRIYAAALALTGCRADAEEVAGDTLLRAHRALGRYDGARIRELRLSAWLHRIAVNAARNRVRDRGPAHAEITEAMAVAAPAAERPDAVAERAVGLHRLREHLGRLPRAQREAVVLRHVQDLAYDDVATALRRPVGTVKSDVHRGLARLRAGLGARESDDG
jgi:RNA polymerase sigma factor (sigma-70 family)